MKDFYDPYYISPAQAAKMFNVKERTSISDSSVLNVPMNTEMDALMKILANTRLSPVVSQVPVIDSLTQEQKLIRAIPPKRTSERDRFAGLSPSEKLGEIDRRIGKKISYHSHEKVFNVATIATAALLGTVATSALFVSGWYVHQSIASQTSQIVNFDKTPINRVSIFARDGSHSNLTQDNIEIGKPATLDKIMGINAIVTVDGDEAIAVDSDSVSAIMPVDGTTVYINYAGGEAEFVTPSVEAAEKYEVEYQQTINEKGEEQYVVYATYPDGSEVSGLLPPGADPFDPDFEDKMTSGYYDNLTQAPNEESPSVAPPIFEAEPDIGPPIQAEEPNIGPPIQAEEPNIGPAICAYFESRMYQDPDTGFIYEQWYKITETSAGWKQEEAMPLGFNPNDPDAEITAVSYYQFYENMYDGKSGWAQVTRAVDDSYMTSVTMPYGFDPFDKDTWNIGYGGEVDL